MLRIVTALFEIVYEWIVGSRERRGLRRIYGMLPDEYNREFRNIRLRHPSKIIELLEAFARGQALLKEHKFGRIFSPQKKVSFIYPYYGKSDTILRSIESIKKQKLRGVEAAELEIIVIDDGSPEPGISKVLPADVIYLWRNKFGYGISRSRNLGAKIANGEILVFLDPDLILNPDYVESMLGQFRQFGPRAVLTGYLRDYHYAGCEDPRAAFGVWEKPDIPTQRYLMIAGGNMAIRRELFIEAGAFDEDLIYGEVEDTVFGYVLGELPGTCVVYSTAMTVDHIPHPKGLAHAQSQKSWDVAAVKYPKAYQAIVAEGRR